jgi:hypothetical protein
VAWASLDNERSFWFTRPSLFNLLTRVGFTSVYTCQTPAFPGQTLDRDTLVAVKGSPQQLVSTPVVNDWPEERPMGVHPAQASLSNKVLTRTLGWTRRLFR